jgi:CRISPR-associated protein Csx14
MAEASIPVDLLNPGQVFACLGFLEAADILLGEAEGGFDWSDPAETRFRLRAAGEENPVEAVLAFLAGAQVRSLSPDPDRLSTEKWGVPTDALAEGAPFPFTPPASPAPLPARLVDPGAEPAERREIPVEYWGDSTERDNVKFFAGAAGYPGAGLLRDALDLIRELKPGGAMPLFDLAAPQSSSFRFDWRRDYIAIDSGFAVNEHNDITMMGYPLVELMAAIGVSHARPLRLDKLNYRYGVAGIRETGALLAPLFLRAALGCAELPFPRRTFSMVLGWPGQENQARCITSVAEEPRT